MQFKLSLQNNKRKSSIFALPKTNHYQQIKNLVFDSATPQLVVDRWGNTVGISKNSANVLFDLRSLSFKGGQDKTTSDNNLFLKSNRFINGRDEKIKKLSKKIIRNGKNTQKNVFELYHFTLDYLTYGKPTEGLYSYQQAMGERVTDCGGFSTFLASLLQAVHIPSRLVVGFLIKENLYAKLFSRFDFCVLNFEFLSMHAWLEVLLPNHFWFPLDPSIEWRRKKGLTKREGGFGFVPADRLVTSFGQDFEIKVNDRMYRVDLLQNPVYL